MRLQPLRTKRCWVRPFDSVQPLRIEQSDRVTVLTPEPRFTLADVIGSTSAAPGALLNAFGEPEWFPILNYWSPRSPAMSNVYSVIDGATLENSGILPLLRRGYPVILAFVNAEFPVGAESPFTTDGVSATISRLFGFRPQSEITTDQDVQVFPQEQFPALTDGLRQAKRTGQAPWFMDTYSIVQPNALDLPRRDVTVVWFHNDLNQGWRSRLRPEIEALLTADDPANNFRNFPNYDIVAQNRGLGGLPELLNLTAEQVNLIAHMWAYTIVHDAGELLTTLASGGNLES